MVVRQRRIEITRRPLDLVADRAHHARKLRLRGSACRRHFNFGKLGKQRQTHRVTSLGCDPRRRDCLACSISSQALRANGEERAQESHHRMLSGGLLIESRDSESESVAFYVYMLQCVDGSYYAGHTDDLERRLAMHRQGLINGYTSTRLPVE